MNSKYAVTNDIQTWSDFEKFNARINAARRKRELSEYDWEYLLDEAVEQVKKHEKETFLNEVLPVKDFSCPENHATTYKGIKKNR